MGKMIFRLVAAGLIALTAPAAGLAAGSATAATVPTLATSSAVTVRAGAVPNVPSALQCGWRPANNANAPGAVDYNSSSSYYMYNGPDYGCGRNESYAVNGDPVTVHCGWYNYNENMWWDYLYNWVSKTFGWVPNPEVTWEGNGDGC